MVDTARRLSTMAGILGPNVTGNISAQDMRDLMQSSHAEAMGWYNVKTFGVQASGGDDRPKIQEAIDALSDPTTGLGGGTLFFPPGEYRIHSPLNLTKAQIRFVGVGKTPPVGYSQNKQYGTRFKWYGPADQDMFYIRDSANCHWVDMALEGNNDAQPRALLHFEKQAGDQTGSNKGGFVVDGCQLGFNIWSSEGVYKGEMKYGILVDGADNNDNNGFHIQNTDIASYSIAGFRTTNSNSGKTTMRGVGFGIHDSSSGFQTATAISVNSPLVGYAMWFGANGTDLDIEGSGSVIISGYESERYKKMANMGPNAQLVLRGGYAQNNYIAAGQPFISANSAQSVYIHLEGLYFSWPHSSADRTIQVSSGGGTGNHSTVVLHRNHGLNGTASYNPVTMLDVDPFDANDHRTVIVKDNKYNFYKKETNGNPIVVS